MAETKKISSLDKYLPWILLVGSIVAFLAAFILMVERIDGLKNPSLSPVCDLNPVFSCSSVTASPQASAFGFPNPLIGVAGFAITATIGAALLAGAKFKRWFWLAAQAGLIFAMAFVTWLQFQSLYRIGALCLFCMVVWAMTIPMFWYLTLYNLRHGYISTPDSLKVIVGFVQRHHVDILVVWFLVIIALILKRFWYYWSTLV